MGARKRLKAEATKEARKNVVMASLNNCPTSPRKMRLVADMIRGMEVQKALFLLKNSGKEASGRLEKLLQSALSNWEQKNEGSQMDDASLVVQEVQVNGGRMLKRVQPAPQGRAHRVRKRSNHVMLIVGSAEQITVETVNTVENNA